MIATMDKSYIFLAPGFEEIEAVAPIDILRRAGMDVAVVAVTDDGSEAVEGAHGLPIVADIHINDLPDTVSARWLILPGGMPGASNLAASSKLCGLVRSADQGIAAICASPAVVLAPLGLLDGRSATCYPGFEEQCTGAEMTGAPVVAEQGLITAKGPGFAMDFALAIVRQTLGDDAAESTARAMLL